MDESRLLQALGRVDDLGEPDPGFLDELLEASVAEIDFGSSGRPATRRVAPRVRPLRRLGVRRSRWPLLAVAVLLLGGALATIGVGALRDRLHDAQADLLTQVRGAGRITVAVRPDHPQFAIAGQVATGFDVDVAQEVARRLGVSPNVVVVPAGEMLSPPTNRAWSLALPSVPAWTIPASGFASSTPYYAWPHLGVVPATSSITTLADVTGGVVCAVAGDAGEAWLRGTYGGAPAPATGATIVTTTSDDACLAMVASGEAAAAVTADLTPGDLAARGGFRTVAGPAPEPRVIVAVAGAATEDPSALMDGVDAALEGMRQDGTLARLSENRFGLDLTQP